MALVNIPFGFMAPLGDLLLDQYGDDIGVALSLRKLRSVYAGPSIRISRASDSQEQDVYFSGEDLDTGAINTFCSGTTCKVVKFYDQSGNGNDFGDDNGPLIYSSSAVITSRGLPTLDFRNSASEALHYSGSTGYAYSGSYSIYTVVSGNTASQTYMFGSSGLGSRPAVIANYTGNSLEWYNTARQTFVSSPSTTEVQQLSAIHRALPYNSTTGSYSGSQAFAATDSVYGTQDLESIGGSSPTQDYFKGYISEFILYIEDKSADNTGILTNQNNYYSMF